MNSNLLDSKYYKIDKQNTTLNPFNLGKICGIFNLDMTNNELEFLADQIVKLNPFEKGRLFSLFLTKEKEKKTGSRKDLYGSVKLDREITDEEIESILYKSKFD